MGFKLWIHPPLLHDNRNFKFWNSIVYPNKVSKIVSKKKKERKRKRKELTWKPRINSRAKIMKKEKSQVHNTHMTLLIGARSRTLWVCWVISMLVRLSSVSASDVRLTFWFGVISQQMAQSRDDTVVTTLTFC